MAKDPAFLFYSTLYYEGTRLMLPEERACYVDLMVYQHQNGYIPNDLKRVLMYCSGVNEATLQATLQAKFNLCDKGWYNEKLNQIIEERKEFSNKQSENGLLGQFFKKAKSTLSPSKYKELRDYTLEKYGKENLILELKKEETTHEAMLEALLKHLTDKDKDTIKDKDLSKNKFKEFWDLYNKKRDRDRVEKKFDKLKNSEVTKIMEVVSDYVKSTPDKKFRKDPLTWLNGKCWEDEIELPPDTSKTNQLQKKGKFPPTNQLQARTYLKNSGNV